MSTPSEPASALGFEHVPRERFLSPEFLRAEFTHLWPRVWQIAGPIGDLPESGSCFTFELGFDSILAVRQDDGSIRAFHNLCRHRGRRLREPGLGKVTTLRCAYHGWTWGTDGALKTVPDIDSFPSVKADCPSLKRVSCEVWAGFVWINLDPKAAPLAEFLGPVRAPLDDYGLDPFVLLEDRTKEVRANWKIAADAFNESYHVRQLHPELASSVGAGHTRPELFGLHGRLVVPFYSHRSGEGRVRGPDWLPKEVGVDPATLSGDPPEVRRTLQKAIRAKALADDLDISRLSDEQLTDAHIYSIFPNMNLQVQWSKFTLRRYRPHPTDPGLVLMDVQQYKRPKRGQTHPRPEHLHVKAGEGSLGYPDDEDIAAMETTFLGMRSSAFDGQVLGDQELILRNMHRGLDVYMRL